MVPAGLTMILAMTAIVALARGLLGVASTTAIGAMSTEVRRRLATGEVIVTDVLPPGASRTARGGTAVALVRASPEAVWRVIADPRTHPRYYPRVTDAEVVETDGRRVVVHYRVSVGPISFGFFMDKYADAARRRIDWQLADGRAHGLFRENSGYWQLEATDAPDTSLVTYAIAVRTMLPGFFTEGAERASLTDTVTALRKLVEAPR